MADLDFTEFDTVFQRFAESPTSTTVFRWEGRQSYGVERDNVALAAWREGRALPERSVRTNAWVARIAVSTVRGGKQWSRVRYVEEPWNDYTAFELDGYRESVAVGDQTYVTTVPLSAPQPDFWLLGGDAPDDRCAILMHYDDDGQPTRFEWTNEPGRLAELHAYASEAMASAVPVSEYMSRHAVAGAS